MTPGQYLKWLFATALVGGAMVALLNYLVDPYLVFGRPRVRGINDIKPAVDKHEPMMKAYQASRAQARTVVLGGSRVAIGLDPDAPVWPTQMRPVYNLGVAGADLADSVALLRVVLANQEATVRPTTVMVGLDFESFLYRRPTAKSAHRLTSRREQEERLQMLQRSGGTRLGESRHWKDIAVSLLTLDALLDSVATVRRSVAGEGFSVLLNGKSSEWQLRTWTQADGAGQMFEQKLALTARQYRRSALQLSEAADEPIPGMQPLRDLLALAKQQKLHVILAINPSHVLHIELLDAAGFWPDIERWKRGLAIEVDSVRASGIEVQLWDFADYEEPFLESLPGRQAGRKALRWFWDPVHYNSALGERLLASMLASTGGADALGAPLGVVSVDHHLASVRSQRDAYRAAHPELARELAMRVCGRPVCIPTP